MSNIQNLLTGLNDRQRAAVTATDGKFLVLASAGSGKALKNGSKVQTPKGPVTIESLQLGDSVFGADGKPCNVKGVFPQGKKEVYEVEFSDGTIVECNDEHLWTYQTASMRSNSGKWKTASLKEIMDTVPLKTISGDYQRHNVYIPMTEPVEYTKKELPLDPYLLGALLGDGCLRQESQSFSNSEDDVLENVSNSLSKIDYKLRHISRNDYRVIMNKTKQERHKKQYFAQSLYDLGLLGAKSDTKFIPEDYRYSSVEDRISLLQGLIDTDGYIQGSQCEYTTASPFLSRDIKEICESLGLSVSVGIKPQPTYIYKGERKISKPSYRLAIKTSHKIPKIHSSDKHEQGWKKGQSVARRSIRAIRKTDRLADMTCISVDNESELFLTDNFIVTHNTRVLTHRIAYLIEIGVKPWEIVGISFTKKASNEIKERMTSLIGEPAVDVNMGTFHSLCMRILLQHQGALGMSNITILDEYESKKIITDIAITYGFMSEDSVYEIKSSIDKWGNEGWNAEDVRGQENIPKDVIDIFEEYASFKKAVGYVDFNDILYLTSYLFKIRPDILESYSKKYKYIMIDESQDLNNLQFTLLTQLSSYHQNFMLLGDDLQCQPAGTKVFSFNGIEQNIEDIKVGQLVLTFDVEKDFHSFQPVLEVAKHPAEPIYLVEAGDLVTRYSQNHICYIYKKDNITVTQAKNLKKGDKLVRFVHDYTSVFPLESIEIKKITIQDSEHVYGLSVGTNHNYVADGILTHNCIYSFRGSNIKNMMDIRTFDPQVETILLEQNYRSSDTIVKASNAFIANNKKQLEKVSFTDNDTGSPVFIYDSIDESREAEYIVKVIEGLIKTKGMDYGDFAILYRSNYLSRNIEFAFGQAGIPYEVVGGSEFYERDEIKTIVCYLRAVDNDMDDLAFERIINNPKRGIGDTTVNRIKMYASASDISFFKAMQHVEDIPKINKPTKARIGKLVDIILGARELIVKEGQTINSLMNYLILQTHFMEQYDIYKSKDAEKIQNIQELWNVAISFDHEEHEELTEGQTILTQFLTETALYSIEEDKESKTRVTLTTAHSSKG